jgi:benzylsuccinate CoA-transferase BbsF subunit
MSSDGHPEPLAGIRVADFSWVIAGPWATKILAYFGAEVIRIESRSRPDALRLYHDPEHGPQVDWTARFNEFNAGKFSVSLDLRQPEAQDIAKRLVGISDIVVENFSLHGMRKFGLSYETLREVNPQLIMLSMQAMGRSGPYCEYVTYGPNLMSLTGLVDLSGYPDAEPSSMGLVFPDYSNGILGAWLLLGALDYRRRTGQGQYLDMSQYESLAALMQPAVLDYSANQRLASRQGNRHSVYVPHNCYPCQGAERYCVIVVKHDTEWQGLCTAMGHPEWTQQPEFATFLQRRRHRQALDAHIAAWTRQHRAEEVMARLQAHGVRAGVVQHIADLTEHDPHLRAREFFKTVRHTLQGDVPISGLPWECSGTPGYYHRAAPCLGEHNPYVYGELLGMSAQEIADYTTRGIFY